MELRKDDQARKYLYKATPLPEWLVMAFKQYISHKFWFAVIYFFAAGGFLAAGFYAILR